LLGTQSYDNPSAKAHKFDLENNVPFFDEEDEETVAAIDQGLASFARSAFPLKLLG